MSEQRERRTIRGSTHWEPWRWPIDMTASVQEQGSCAFDIKVVDISLAGCRIFAGFRLHPGSPVRITMDGFAPFRGRVTGAEDWYATIGFDQLIHTSVLSHLVSRHPPRIEALNEANDR